MILPQNALSHLVIEIVIYFLYVQGNSCINYINRFDVGLEFWIEKCFLWVWI